MILVRHDYPNNSSILGELYNTWVLAHMLATFMSSPKTVLRMANSTFSLILLLSARNGVLKSKLEYFGVKMD